MFDGKPLSHEIDKRRWLFFGHVLRMDETTPAQIAPKSALDTKLKRRRGRPRDCLLSSLQKDVQDILRKQLNSQTLDQIKDIARDKKRWIKVFTYSEDVE